MTETDSTQYKHLLNEMELSWIWQMGENIRGIRDNAEHPKETLSVVLIYLTSILYAGTRWSPEYDPREDLLKIIDDYQTGAIDTYKDFIVKMATELDRIAKEDQDAGSV